VDGEKDLTAPATPVAAVTPVARTTPANAAIPAAPAASTGSFFDRQTANARFIRTDWPLCGNTIGSLWVEAVPQPIDGCAMGIFGLRGQPQIGISERRSCASCRWVFSWPL
jgi:hypothetical protein